MTATIQVITTCTSRKLALEESGVAPPLPGLGGDRRVAAEDLYTGEQHRRLMAGVRQVETTWPVELWVISAKEGLISGKDRLASYDESFAGMPANALRALADRLQIPRALRSLLATPAALTLMLIGNDYFDAAALERPVTWASPTLLLASPSRCDRLLTDPNLVPVAVSQALAKFWSLPLTLLKGELVRRMLCALAAEEATPEALFADRGTREHLLVPERLQAA